MKPRIFLGFVRAAGEAAPGAHPGAPGHRRRRAVDDGLQPGCLDPRPARRAHARGRLRRVRLRPGRLDDRRARRPTPPPDRPRRATTSSSKPGCSAVRSACAARSSSTRDGAKLPTDLLGLTSIRYDPDTTPAIVRQINQKLRKAIDAEGRISRLEGDWWQLSLTARTELEPSADLAADDQPGSRRCARGRGTVMAGRRHAVRALLERGVEGTSRSGQHLLLLEGRASASPERSGARGDRRDQARSVDRANGYFTTRSDGPDPFHARTSGIYLRADPGDKAVLDGNDAAERAALIERRLEEWRSANS